MREMDVFQRQQVSSYLDDVVVIRQPENPGEPCVITINCPDKTGLGCDFCRILLLFGLNIVRGDLSTDGKWCFIVFWVVGRGTTRWELLKKRLLGACPSPFEIQSYCFSQVEQPREPQFFLLKFWCYDRSDLLHDVTQVLCELELTIRRVNVSTTPDGRVLDLFFITDTRELLHTKGRREDTCAQLKVALGGSMINCEIELASGEMATCFQTSAALPPAITDEIFHSELLEEPIKGSSPKQNNVSITMDNSLSPSHTLIQIFGRYQKGLLYDIMRTLKDYNIQLSYGRFYSSHHGNCEIDLFVMQVDGKKIVDPDKQKVLSSCLRMEVFQPLQVTLINRGPDMELLVANPVESSGKGRPLVFYDVTLALKILSTCIFTVTIGRHLICDREWEVYRILLDDNCKYPAMRNTIEDGVMRKLMGWD